MKYRKLRVAWSVGCGVLCLLLIALWVRSYFGRDKIDVFNIVASSGRGKLTIDRMPKTLRPPRVTAFGVILPPRRVVKPSVDVLGFYVGWNSSADWMVSTPHRFWVALFGLFAAAPWVCWSFSLRELLIGMVAAAAILELTHWALTES
jgi:hypothetical protein